MDILYKWLGMGGDILWVVGGCVDIFYRWVGLGEVYFGQVGMPGHFLLVGGGGWRYIWGEWGWGDIFYG